MKIAIFHNLPFGGAIRVVGVQVGYLKKKHELKVFKLDEVFKGNRLKKDFDNFVSLAKKHRQLAQKVDSQQFDVALVHPDRLTQAPFILRYLKTPNIYFCEELLRIAYEKEFAFKGPLLNKIYENTTRKIRKKIDRENAQSADVIITASEYIRNKVSIAYGKRAKVAHLGVDTKLFIPSSKKVKQLLFVGERNEIDDYNLARKIAKKAKVSLKVISGFKLDDRELSREYSRSVATLCLQHNEPFGLAAIESMACGTPVLAVQQGGYKETVVNKKTGFLLPRSADKFTKKVEQIIASPGASGEMGKAARRHVLRNFKWRIHNESIEQNLIEIASVRQNWS